MFIETERTKITAFTLELIDAAISGNAEELSRLGYFGNGEWPEPDLLEALPVFRNLITENGVNGFNSWLISDKMTGRILGSIGFIGNPDETGGVEIGFGIVPSQRRKGYCIEALRALLNRAKALKGLYYIKAQCDPANEASKKILEKAGFKMTGSNEGLYQWELRV